MRRITWLCVVPLAVLAVVGGPAQAKKKAKEQLSTEMATVEVRARVYEYAERFAGVVENASDEILRQTTDPAITRRALLWKINAIPACHLAVFQSNPVAGGIDVWALTLEMAQFFREGNGRDLFGEWQPIAVDASHLLEGEIRELARLVAAGDPVRAGSFVESWSAEHPLEDLSFVRASTRPLLARVAGDRKGGAFASVGRLEEQLNDLSERLTIYAGVLPRHARWQAQLLYDEVIRTPEVAGALENADALREVLERTADRVDELPELVDTQVAAVLKTMREEIDKTLSDVDRQRRDTLKTLQAERAIVLAAVRDERIATIDALAVERSRTLEEVDERASGMLDQASLRVERLADRLFWRAFLLGGLLAAVLIVAGFFALRSLTRIRAA